jgi:2,4-dienoyl-CoA reductase (NADPH2)
MARLIPGKAEFNETIRYFQEQIKQLGIHLHLDTRVEAAQLQAGGFDEVVLATGVVPRSISLPGINHPKVLGYTEVLLQQKAVGSRVAIIGAGGIGFDLAEYLSDPHPGQLASTEQFMQEWGVDMAYRHRGAITRPESIPSARKIYLLQRSSGKPGAGLGKTTGWIHRASLRQKQVEMIAGATYHQIDDQGLHLTIEGRHRLLEVDHIVICAGQEPVRDLLAPLQAAGLSVHLIGGADAARELDARRAIDQGARLAARL